MHIADHERNHEYCLEQAARLLGIAVRPLSLAFNVEQMLRPLLVLEERLGIGGGFPHLMCGGGPKGLHLEFGLERYRLDAGGRTLCLARICAPHDSRLLASYYDFWAVPVDDYRRLYRFLRRLEHRSLEPLAPIIRETERQRLWDNTIGFLRHGREVLQKFGMPQKRGIVLLGEPGNGKTMACRWLLAQCHRHGLKWRSVTAEEYEVACQGGEVRELFELEGPGIVLFDDLDQALRDRDQADTGTRRTTFLTELDGLYPRTGIVFLFTSNSSWNDLDPAFRRPGRIDLHFQFSRPDEGLRRKFVLERWHPELVGAIDVETAVNASDGLSFAEIDEVRKLLVLNYLESGRWDWNAGWSTFCESRRGTSSRNTIGFAASAPRSHQALSAEGRHAV